MGICRGLNAESVKEYSIHSAMLRILFRSREWSIDTGYQKSLNKGKSGAPKSMWRYRELLPVDAIRELV